MFKNKARQLAAIVGSVLVSVTVVAGVVYATTFIDRFSLSVGSSTPGSAVSVSGAGGFDGFISANYFTSTSTTATSWLLGKLGIGTTTPSVTLGTNGIGVEGAAIVGNFIYTSFLTATSTTATSTFYGGVKAGSNGGLSSAAGLTITGGQIQSSGKLVVTDSATSTISNAGFTAGGSSNALVADGSTGSLGVATTSFPEIQNNASASAGSRVNVNVGAGTASTTLYIAGGASVGSSIILQSTDGSGCIAIMATRGGAAVDSLVTLSAKVVACPKP